jgi:hypothetical protein
MSAPQGGGIGEPVREVDQDGLRRREEEKKRGVDFFFSVSSVYRDAGLELRVTCVSISLNRNTPREA